VSAVAVQLTLVVRNDLALSAPLARTSDSWISFGFPEDLDEAVLIAVEGILDVMERELSTDRLHAIALASVVVDLRLTQIANGKRESTPSCGRGDSLILTPAESDRP
jgi:acetamidase/formamidase